MKNHLLIIFLIYPAIGLFAQTTYGTPEERAQKMTFEMNKTMNLSEEQTDTVRALNLKYARRIQKEVVDTDLNKWQQYRRVKKINQAKERELLPLLTGEQRVAYQALKEAKLQEMWERFF